MKSTLDGFIVCYNMANTEKRWVNYQEKWLEFGELGL